MDELNEGVVTAIIKSANESIKTSGCRNKKNMPWKDKKNCRQAVKEWNRAFRLLNKHHSMESLVQYKSSQAVIRRTVGAAILEATL